MKKYLTAACLSLLVGCSSSDTQPTANQALPTPVATVKLPSPPRPHIKATPFAPADGDFDQQYPDNSPMLYQGGEVMITPANVYFIWYGDWKNSKTPDVLEYMMSHVGNSDWFNINTAYSETVTKQNVIPIPSKSPIRGSSSSTSTQKYFVDGSVNFVRSITDEYSHGKLIHKSDMIDIIYNNINNNSLPLDPDGVYFVIVSKDVDETDKYDGFNYSFCGDFCGWHDYTVINNVPLKIVFAGDTDKCPDACSIKSTYESFGFNKSPNDNWSADAMASALLHELAEVVVDPYPTNKNNSGWKTELGYESADNCAWNYGKLYLSQNGSVANVKFGDKDFLVQQNWVMDDEQGNGHCGLRR